MIPLTAVPWRLLGTAGIALALAGAGWWLRHTGYVDGEAAGAAEVRQAWDRDIAARQAATEALRRAAAAREVEQARIAREQETALREQIQIADARGRDLARRLSAAYAANARERSLPGPADPAPGADAAGGVPGDGGAARRAVDVALEEHLAACARDAERLEGWRQWWEAVSLP